MIKPDAYKNTGNIIDEIYKNGFRIARIITTRLSVEGAQEFYEVHKDKPFFK